MAVLLLAALAVAPAVRADPGAAEDATPAVEAGVPQGEAAEDVRASGDPGDAPAHAAEPGSSGDAPGHAAEPGGSGKAPGDAAEPGHSGDAPGHQEDAGPAAEHDQGASVGQAADASASAGQRDVDNTAVTVRVDDPGNGKKVGQENRAVADANASTEAFVDSPGETTVGQVAHANADASQADVSNTSIVVRVGSAGDEEGVSQANVASGSAAATSISDDAASGVADAAAAVTQDGVANTSVSIRVFSPGDDGSVSQLNAAAAAAETSPAGTQSALARQEAVQNTTVSIRVESPGAAAAPIQQNRATVVTSPADDAAPVGGVALAVASDARNTVLTVAVGGAALDRPGPSGLQVWVWTWVWQRDEAQGLGDLAALQPDSWSWSWDGSGSGTIASRGNVTSRAANDDDRARAGSLEWSWDWTRAGVAGWSWDWNRQVPLSCASCIWIWNWSWSWTGQPGDDDRLAPPVTATDPSIPGQLNAVTAQASATALAGVTQTVVQDGSGGSTQFAGQLAAVAQDVRAVADAHQADVSSLAWGGGTGRANLVASVADADVAGVVQQDIEQSLDGTRTAWADQWAGQQAELTQLAGADAAATQRDVLLVDPEAHTATSVASATGAAAVDQRVTQGALTRGGSLLQWVGQLTLVEQAADAGSVVVQRGGAGSRRTGGAAAASAGAGDLALVAQHAEQSAAREQGAGSQSATQLSFTGQDASASATTAQQAGTAALRDASSGASALTRSLVLQDGSQSATGSSLVVQELLQESIVVQFAAASSTSNGGVAGRATVVDCAVVQQGAVQSVGAGASLVQRPDASAFCLPVTAPPTSSPVVLEAPTATGGEEVTAAVAPATGAAPASAADEALPLPVDEGTTVAAKPQVARRSPWSPSAPSALAPAARLVPGHTEFSAPPSPQARIDTRTGSHAGAGDAGREPPLPPAGDPPRWVSALAAAASGAGPSGIAAILFAFALVAPLLLRAPQGSVVRRPTDVLARIDVPV